MTDRAELVKTLQGVLGSVAGTTDVPGEVTKMVRRKRLVFRYYSNQAANTNVPEALVDLCDSNAFTNGYKVLTCKFTPAANITADNSAPIVFTLAKRAQGGAATTISTANTATTAAGGLGSLTSFTSYALTTNTSASEVAANSVLTLTTTIGAFAGNNVAGGEITVEVEAL
jgi:hypothetical protein